MNKSSIKQYEKLIKIIVGTTKPFGVVHIDFTLEPINDFEFYLSLKYIVPDDSPYLNTGSMKDLQLKRIDWNNEIKETIENYLNIEIIINSSGIMSKSFYEKK